MRRAQIKAECPYFKRLGENSVICEGLSPGGRITVKFASYAERERWVLERCCSARSFGAACSVARMLGEDDDRARGPDSRAHPEKLRRVSVVLHRRQIEKLKTYKKVVLAGGIYSAIFGGVPSGERFLCTVIPAGEKVGRDMLAVVGRAGGSWMLTKA